MLCQTNTNNCVTSGVTTPDAELSLIQLKNKLESILALWIKKNQSCLTPGRQDVLIELMDRIEALNNLL